MSVLSNEVVIEVADEDLGLKDSKLKMPGIRIYDIFEDIRKENGGLKTNSVRFTCESITDGAQEISESREFEEKIFRKEREKTKD